MSDVNTNIGDPAGTGETGPEDISGADAGGARISAAQRVAARLRDMIVEDELPPGTRIRERTLAQQLDVSRTPMREALRILATEGLVELLPNRGAVVADPKPDEVEDLLLVLGALESLAGELATARATDPELLEIRALHHDMLAAYARENRLQYFKFNQCIHRAIVAASRNPALIETHRRINAQLYRVRYRSNLSNKDWHKAVEEHENILRALEARDGTTLAVIMRQHLGSTWKKVSESFGASDGVKTVE